MRNGLYKVAFSTPLGAGYGVVYAQDGKIRGGDSGIYYLGTYSVEGSKLAAHIQTDRHAPILGSVFGRDRVNIDLQGAVQGDFIKCTGTSPEAPGVNFSATLDRIAD